MIEAVVPRDVTRLGPGSVIRGDSLLMRTRFANWVSDGGFTVSDKSIIQDIHDGSPFDLLFDSEAS